MGYASLVAALLILGAKDHPPYIALRAPVLLIHHTVSV
jgi:hypothetical protein